MGWVLWLIAVSLGAVGLALILHLIPSLWELFRAFRAGFRGEDPKQHNLTPKQQALNEEVIRRRRFREEEAELGDWQGQFNKLSPPEPTPEELIQKDIRTGLQRAIDLSKVINEATPKEKEK